MLARFHPAVASWFTRRFGAPTEPQQRGWPEIVAGHDTLIAAPTGSGKTLAAFLAAIDALVREGLTGPLPDETRVLYVSPLRALASDIEANLQTPLHEIAAELRTSAMPTCDIRTAVRTGDTTAAARARTVRQPPHVFVTTPESLYILLTSEGGRRMLASVRTVIVDEIHALVTDKRGSHLALSLERLDDLCRRHGHGERPQRIGLSATQKPIEAVARFLVGARAKDDEPLPCRIVDVGHARALELAIEVPASPLETVMAHEIWEEVYDRITALIAEHRTTLVFVNSRRLAERVARHLGERIGDELVTAHHGSLARSARQRAEARLRNGELRALVATASLELGIDIGTVDLVCQVGSPRSIATLLQRVGRSGHAVRATPRGRLFPTSRDELVEMTALLDAVRRGELDRLCIPEAPTDILAQQIVAACAAEDWDEDALFTLVRGAWPYRALERSRFDRVIEMLSEGIATGRGRRGAHLHRDAVNHRVRGRRGARLVATTSGGAIPDLADYDVVLEPQGIVIGTLNEDFAIESMVGDIVQLGNTSWRILRVESGRVRVEDAHGQPPNIPFWLGEAPGRTAELSTAVCRLRDELLEHMQLGADFRPDAALDWLHRELGVQGAAAEQLCDYLGAAHQALGALPSERRLVLERFFDEAGGMQLVLHAPFGTRVNRAWGLALRKRFCQRFDFELQAAATDDAIVLSLGPVHSFALHDVFGYLRADTVRELLVQALLDSPMFAARWRWNVGRALAVPRFSRGRKVPPQLQRMRADDLLTVVFPDQVACFENLSGPREIPDHPLVDQTIVDCLTEAMDIDRFIGLLRAVEAGDLELVARDLPEPSPLAAAILSARPWAFLDDAPLEERRTRAVATRRWLDPKQASDLGALDASAIAEVRGLAWPRADDEDELHDALMLLGALRHEEMVEGRTRDDRSWLSLAKDLFAHGRASCLDHASPAGDRLQLWVATERLPMVRAALASDDPLADAGWDPAEARTAVVRGRLECTGPTTSSALGELLGLDAADVEAAVVALESQGLVLRGHFEAGVTQTQWCERGLLARIHRRTLNRLRAEIAPVCTADFVRFLARWQHLTPEHQVEGPDGLAVVLEQLEGFEAAAGAWEREVLPARVRHYDPAWLDQLCLSGRSSWLRCGAGTPGQHGPIQTTRITLAPRPSLPWWRSPETTEGLERLGVDARRIADALTERGASFVPDLAEATGLEPFRVEDGLAELVAQGMATCDGFAGLRSLLGPHRRGTPVGRWSLLRGGSAPDETARVEHAARVLLRRYGVMMRKLLERERWAPPWYALVRVYRTWEARGEIRGGRFVEGHAGEQYALPEALTMLREIRRCPPDDMELRIAATDPCNLVGIVLPGPRLPARMGSHVLLRNGVPVAVHAGDREQAVHVPTEDRSVAC